MIDSKTIIRTLMTSVFTLMLVCCADDEANEQGELTRMQLIPYGSSFTDASQSSKASTRTIADGYEKYTSTVAGAPNIAIYLADKDNDCSYKGDFTHNADDTWTSSVYAQTNTQYYIYGFMPSDLRSNASITSIEGGYSKGAIITLSNMPAISSSDIAVITGVLKGATGDGDISTNTSKKLEPGAYGYLTSAAGEDNYMYLLLDHLYSCINLCFAVDEDYNELRTIKVKSVVMEVVDAPKTATAKVTLTAGATQTMSAEMTFSDDKANASSGNLVPSEGITLTTAAQDVSQYCTPGLSSLTFNVTTKYNVYDKKGNLVRENCQATNSNITITNTTAGKSYNINMTVTPTYLYQLSQPDLDDPTIVVN